MYHLILTSSGIAFISLSAYFVFQDSETKKQINKIGKYLNNLKTNIDNHLEENTIVLNDKKIQNNSGYDCFTKKGEKVRSQVEKKIADLLFKLDINYKIENPIYCKERKKYNYPDFYLTDYDLYIEYYGRYKKAGEIGYDYKYNCDIGKKRKFFKDNKIKIAEIWPNNIDNLENILIRRLKKVEPKIKIKNDLMIYNNK